ncbi:hypothetical protein KAR48_13060 [bacterium]|nr:hypothetical protein [bacterium]
MTNIFSYLDEKGYFQSIISEQFKMHRMFGVEDLYKMCHQICFGGSHAVMNRERIEEGIISEWGKGERPANAERMLELIDPRGEVLRVNIRIWEKNGESVSGLADMFIDSWTDAKGDHDRMNLYGEYLEEFLEKENITVNRADINDLWSRMRESQYPAISHSKEYVQANRPAYRVIQKKHLKAFK